MSKIYLNADMGEGMNSDKELMPFLNFANIACGGHFGDQHSIISAIELAKKHKVKVGAHPSYPDKENFGRSSINISQKQLEVALLEQINLFQASCKKMEVKMNHIKLHGALYSDIFNSKELTKWFVNWIQIKYPSTPLFIPISAQKNIPTQFLNYYTEAFADRNYDDDLTLISRKEKNACINNLVLIKKHVLAIKEGKINTNRKTFNNLKVSTLCVHGDHPKAVEIVKMISELLK